MTADDAAKLAGAPERITGRGEAATFFNGSAHAAPPVFVGDHPAAAWFHRGEAMVLFDFTVVDGLVVHIVFRAEPEVLAQVVRRDGGADAAEPAGGHTSRAPHGGRSSASTPNRTRREGNRT